MEPSAEELRGMDTLSAVLDWVPLMGPLRAALLRGLGATEASLPRIVASIPIDEYDALLGMTLNEAPVTPAQMSQIRMTGATCRLAAGLVLSTEQQRAAAAAAATIAAVAAAAAAAAVPDAVVPVGN
eukprot:16440457-Heterocapsa_arctica.AAC.1